MPARAPLSLLALLAACSADPQTQAVLDTKAFVDDGVADLLDAVTALQDHAPDPDGDGWNATDDAAALAAMRQDWRDARDAYERIEGAIAVFFPDLDAATDERYDGFLGEGPDADLFDGEGVTGVHAVERILWADSHPQAVVDFESALPGYTPAAFPATQAEAAAFRDALLGRLVDDCAQMKAQVGPLALDAPAAFDGVVGSMAEQVEKIALGATGEAESRYAQHTLADMRANLAGGEAIFEAFEPWLLGVDGGQALHDDVHTHLSEVEAAYAAISGDSLPPVPATWDPTDPSPTDLATPYGQLWAELDAQTDPSAPGSLLHALVKVAEALDIPLAL